MAKVSGSPVMFPRCYCGALVAAGDNCDKCRLPVCEACKDLACDKHGSKKG